MPALKIRKGDEVQVITGKDRGKRGTVQEVEPQKHRAVIAGVNISKRHQKPNPQQNIKGGIIEEPRPMDVSKLMLVCPKCGKATRVGHETDENGNKHRVCKACGEEIRTQGEGS
ncbi:MAG: 50S ribosomal protein L24 [Chloroflexi bacterium]|nr:50S ribosomal protein L24 [Chloroflexota bacterium]